MDRRVFQDKHGRNEGVLLGMLNFPTASGFNFAQQGCNFTALVNAPNIVR